MLPHARIHSVFLVFLTLCWSEIPEARATSSTSRGSSKDLKKSSDHCRVAARFIEAKPKRGKIVWVFERLPVGETTCALEQPRFEVWIWQGRYSKVTHSPIYPVYIEEPTAGAEVDLDLEQQDIQERPSRTRYTGWFLAEGEHPVRTRTR